MTDYMMDALKDAFMEGHAVGRRDFLAAYEGRVSEDPEVAFAFWLQEWRRKAAWDVEGEPV